jgi:hypothetical protein
VGVAVQSDFMAGSDDLADLFGERLGGVGGGEPRCFDVVFVPELEEAIDADCCAEDTARNVGGISWCAGFGVQPWDRSVHKVENVWRRCRTSCSCIDVNSIGT